MASDENSVAQATTLPGAQQTLAPPEGVVANGTHPSENSHEIDETSNEDELTTADPFSKNESTSLSATKPIEHVSNGIQPVADFLPKNVPMHSHPTPPPEQPLGSAEPAGDVEMTNGDENIQTLTDSTTSRGSTLDSGLVRLREDDDEEERSAKRNRVDDENLDTSAVGDGQVSEGASLHGGSNERGGEEVKNLVSSERSPAPASAPAVSNSDLPITVKPETAIKTEPSSFEQATPADPSSVAVPQPLSETTPTVATNSVQTAPPTVTPSIEATTVSAPAAPTTAPPAVKYSTAAMTPLQKAFIADKMKNLKKTKHSIAFLRPVDHVALNIPAYPETIKQPMDLGTMEAKLKSDQYTSVQDFVNDFNLIISNCRRFNGDAHPVTQAGLSMEAYFNKMMETVPSPDQALPAKAAKKRSPSVGSKPLPRRESRVATTATPVAPAAPTPKAETYALQPDGTPQIRRDSTGRPARAIKPPQSRDLTYAKPKRKEAVLELKFCEFVLEELSSSKYDKVNSVFLYPVDPVALNIPQYRQIVKHPMDLSTIGQKLRHGQYSKASEFKKDFELMIQNCLTFNPHGNPVRDMGVQFQRDFMAVWSQKERWEKANKPETRGVSQSGDEDSGDEEDDDEDAQDDDKEATIQALQKQLLDMQNTILSMTGGKSAKTKKTKSKTSKKTGAMTTNAKAPKTSASKPKAKKPRQVTYEEKQEISEAVNRMNESQVNRLTQIITENCAKYRDMEEMELEIDDLPNDVQAMLLRYVRSLFGNPNRGRAVSPDDVAAVDDDDFEPSARGGAGGRRKKHKPMGKREQGEAIKNLQSKIAQFGGTGGSGSESPTNARRQADSSSDEESEESEEE